MLRVLGRLVAVGGLALTLFVPGSAAAQQSANDAIPTAFCGSWGQHSASMQITCNDNFPEAAFGYAQWRTYQNCQTDGPPCDLSVGHVIGAGGIASFVVQHVDGAGDSKVTVTTTVTNDTSLFGRVGDVRTLTLQPDGAIQFLSYDGEQIVFCGGPNAAAQGQSGECGA